VNKCDQKNCFTDIAWVANLYDGTVGIWWVFSYGFIGILMGIYSVLYGVRELLNFGCFS